MVPKYVAETLVLQAVQLQRRVVVRGIFVTKHGVSEVRLWRSRWRMCLDICGWLVLLRRSEPRAGALEETDDVGDPS